jgi:2-polyprenyl-3-methyl-5-hydroxy-6-metoxy-1,4-benzoquinol methylase
MEDNYLMFDQLIAKDASIVDVGCGYGFLLHYLALSSPQRQAIGYDYDADKIAVAQKATEKIKNIDFDTLDISEGLDQKADVFILADILHYLPVDLQEKALKVCFDNLNPSGTIIVRDANAEMAEKHKRTKLTEFLSTKIFRFNKTQDESKQLYFITREKLLSFLDKDKVDVEVLDKTKYLSNLVYLIKKK